MSRTNSEPPKRSKRSKWNPFKGTFSTPRAFTFRDTSGHVSSPAKGNAATPSPEEGSLIVKDLLKLDGTTVDATELGALEILSESASNEGTRRGFPASDLADDIVTVMENHKIGLQDSGNPRYLPDRERERLVTPESIRETLGPVSEGFAQWIRTEASKTFVITIISISDQAKRLEAMQAFRRHKFRDSYLPVKNLLKQCKFTWKPSERTTCDQRCNARHSVICRGIHKRRLDCFHHRVWTVTAFRQFYNEQWSLLLQSFRANISTEPGKRQYELPILVIEEGRLLPFLPSEHIGNKVEGGAFAVVHRARMLKDFQNAIHNGTNETINIAIKTVTVHSSQTFDVAKEWWREVEAHKDLGYLDNDHLVQAIAAYQYRGQYCILFEWATGGTLRDYWNTAKYTGLSSDMIRDHLEQLRGLTATLQMMHHTKQAKIQHRGRSGTFSSTDSSRSGSLDLRRRTTTVSEAVELSDHTEDEQEPLLETSRAGTSPEVSANHSRDTAPSELPRFVIDQPDEEPTRPPSPLRDDEDDENWRHGDIKPENILRFESLASSLGTLKLADLGRAKRHKLVTRQRAIVEKDPYRTKNYEPPDLYVEGSDKSMSRLFDVWSLGCVFFECIVWMLYGNEWLQTFHNTTKAVSQDQTPFWTLNEGNADVSLIVRQCMDAIVQHDPECRGDKPSAIRELLDIVRDKMLVVPLPVRTDAYSKDKRANTETILKDLDAIIAKLSDAEYLFTGNERTNLKVLPRPRVKVFPDNSDSVAGADSKHPGSNTYLAAPPPSNSGKARISALNTYSNILVNQWRYEDDDVFAMNAYSSSRSLYNSCMTLEDQGRCKDCWRLNFRQTGLLLTRKVSELESRPSCSLCKVLLARTRAAQLTGNTTINLRRTEAGLFVDTTEGEIGYNSRMRLCRSFANDMPRPTQSSSFVPIGIPRLPDIDSDATFHLINCWLEDCDGGHGDKHLDCVKNMGDFCPNRLLDVGSGRDAHTSRIVKTEMLENPKKIRYLALSHPWGITSKDNPRFVSNVDNIAKHMEMDGIPDSELPRNFRDTVKVARHLKIRYVWIDALCVLQRTETDPGDFQTEAKSMQDIFSSAYCVLAASSASGMASGFLRGRGKPRRRDRHATEVTGEQFTDELVLCDSPDDFQRDVIDGPLSTRAWVLQERALARRTIFFTSNQVYWECSNGVRCESMSKLQNNGAALLGDSNFPAYVEQQTKGDRISLWKGLYTDYCRLQFSESTDKPLAISGLEQRLSQQFADVTAAGVFGKWKGRCLLWMRAQDASLHTIQFANSNPGAWKPPSWSFMAYVGKITYLDIPGGARWENLDLTLKGNANTLWLYANQPPIFNAYARDFDEGAKPDSDTWLLMYDNPGLPKRKDKCVVIGSIGDRLQYVLIVREAAKSKSETGRELYERIGAGYLPKDWIHGEKTFIAVV